MTRDYKNVTEASQNKKHKQKKPRVKVKKEVVAENSIPGWIWLVSGVVIGGFVSFIVYLKLNVPIEVNKSKNEQVKIEKKTTQEKQTANKEGKENKEHNDDELEFYKILPNRKSFFPGNEVDNAKKDMPVKEKNETEQVTKQETKPIQKAPSDPNAGGNKVSYVYTLQVGSFLEFKDADKRKANLAMLGIGSRIHAIKTRNRTHYRVLVGPYDDIERVNRIDAEMKANNIKTLLLREKG